MKKLIALLLILTLGLSCIPAFAATYTVDEKFFGQLKQNGVRGSVTFSVNGNSSSLLDANTIMMLRLIAPRLNISLEHSIVSGKGQGNARILVDSQKVGEINVLYDSTLFGIASTLLNDETIYYTMANNWDYTQLLQDATQQTKEWPPFWHVLLEIANAPEAWKTRAADRKTYYDNQIGTWINSFAAAKALVENGQVITEFTCTIPAQAVKTEIQQLLINLYSDDTMLGLLAEILTAEESAAYLQKSMLSSFMMLADQMNLVDAVNITRRVDAKGASLQDRVTLPFTGNQKLSELTITLNNTEYGKEYIIEGIAQDEMEFYASCLMSEDGYYTGSINVLMPEEEIGPFVIMEEEPERKNLSFAYNLSWDKEDEKYTLSSDLCERTMTGTLVIKPTDETLPPQSVTLTAYFSSKSSERSATSLTGTLTWTDLETDTRITATLSARTASPWAVSNLAEQTTLRLDQLNAQSRLLIVQQWQSKLSSWFDSLLEKLAPTLLSTQKITM